ncbi:MAG TPA: hypothetical protein VL403_16480 [Candidatus Kryptonia bacterium]|nr:hypothetical protein [Candidatus Kryptonia bacterium]
MIRRASLRCLFIAAALLITSPRRGESGQLAHATTAAALARSADTIVLCACDAGVSSWNDTPRIIVTRHQCRVEQAFKGQPADMITVQVLGGRVGDVAMGSSATVSLAPGGDVVLMLRHSQFGPYHVVAGGADGVLPVSPAPQRTVRGMSLPDFARWVATEAAR